MMARRISGSEGCGGGPAGSTFSPPTRSLQAPVLQIGKSDAGHQRVPVQAGPGPALEVAEPEFLLQLLVHLLNGLIANDKFCLTRTLRLRLSYSRARGRVLPSAPVQLSSGVPHRGEDYAASAAYLAPPAHGCAYGDRPAALGPGLPAPPAMDGHPARAGRGAGAPDPAGGTPCA